MDWTIPPIYDKYTEHGYLIIRKECFKFEQATLELYEELSDIPPKRFQKGANQFGAILVKAKEQKNFDWYPVTPTSTYKDPFCQNIPKMHIYVCC